MQLKAEQRRKIADRAAELAVDKFAAWCNGLPAEWEPMPEDLLEMQHELEDELYREFA